MERKSNNKTKQQKQTYSPRHGRKMLYALSSLSIVKLYNDCQRQNRLSERSFTCFDGSSKYLSTDLLSKWLRFIIGMFSDL